MQRCATAVEQCRDVLLLREHLQPVVSGKATMLLIKEKKNYFPLCVEKETCNDTMQRFITTEDEGKIRIIFFLTARMQYR